MCWRRRVAIRAIRTTHVRVSDLMDSSTYSSTRKGSHILWKDLADLPAAAIQEWLKEGLTRWLINADAPSLLHVLNQAIKRSSTGLSSSDIKRLICRFKHKKRKQRLEYCSSKSIRSSGEWAGDKPTKILDNVGFPSRLLILRRSCVGDCQSRMVSFGSRKWSFRCSYRQSWSDHRSYHSFNADKGRGVDSTSRNIHRFEHRYNLSTSFGRQRILAATDFGRCSWSAEKVCQSYLVEISKGPLS